jgi:urea transport system ATP-binding protein
VTTVNENSTAVGSDKAQVPAPGASGSSKPNDYFHDYLEVRNLHVEFDGFVAVNDVSFTVVQGDLRFLIGPNGAGKTTIIDAITGLAKATGSVRFGNTELLGKKPNAIVREGVGRTFQTASVVEELSVVQNLQIAEGFRRKPLRLLGRTGAVSEEVAQVLQTTGLEEQAQLPAGTLPHGKKQWLEIGMLLVQDAHLLLLDEPVAGMSLEEREETGQLLHRIGKERTVVIVEHDMQFMRMFADSVTVLHQGRVLAEGSVEEVQANAEVMDVYLGQTEESHA